MSIIPKKLTKGQDSFTIFHMNICNNSRKMIEGKINYKIMFPNGFVDELNPNRLEKINAYSEINKYDKYYIDENFPEGRYYVEGRFFWNNENILSDTNKTDFFDLEETK